MAAHRYWRAVGLAAWGAGVLDITEFHLLSGTTRVDGVATLSSSVAPDTGSLSNLSDDDTSTGATWSASALKTLTLNWDFGATSGNWPDVTDIRVGASTSASKFLMGVGIQWSDDNATWTLATYGALNGITWPGARTKTSSLPPYVQWSASDKGPSVTVDSTGLIAASSSTTQSVRGNSPAK